MKNKLISICTAIIVVLIASVSVMAQAPDMMNYQGVARDANGNVIANQQIRLRFKVRENSSVGTVVFNETRKATTNANGLFSVQIGGAGFVTSTNNFASINWGSGKKFLQVEMDPTGGSAFLNMGTQQIISVPYASYANKAGSLDPSVTISPTQIAPYAATPGQVLMYNGTNWVPSNAGSGMNIPYSATGSADSALFTIKNTNNDAAAKAIYGEVINGIGVFGHSENHQGVYGSTNSPSMPGVWGYTYNLNGVGVQGRSYQGTGVFGETTASGTAVRGVSGGTQASAIGVKGESNAAAGFGVNGVNNNGVGVKGTSNGTTTAAVGVTGEANNANGTGVLGASTAGTGVKGTTATSSSVGAAVRGDNNGTAGNGVLGVANFPSGNGVQGSSTTGTGVLGYSNDYRGVAGSTISGTALYGTSITGYALETNGNVKIAGGNTSPGAGKVLTSDANGNATWQSPSAAPAKVAFRAKNVHANYVSIPNGTFTKVEYSQEDYDFGGNFTPNTGTSSANTGTFTVPYNGVYHFSAQAQLTWNVVAPIYIIRFKMMLKRNGNISEIASAEDRPWDTMPDNSQLSTDVYLQAGDQVWLEMFHDNQSFLASDLDGGAVRNFFTGHLVFQQ
jgi:trimeric autotransporter adhesin